MFQEHVIPDTGYTNTVPCFKFSSIDMFISAAKNVLVNKLCK